MPTPRCSAAPASTSPATERGGGGASAITQRRDGHHIGGARFAVKMNFIFTAFRESAMPYYLVLLVLLLLPSLPAFAQEAPGTIQDNSFLVEEAYNQERGVIQHISAFTRLWSSGDWAYTFTEEWPVPGHERHQLSLTMNVVSPGATGMGLGDTLVNYRYQLVGNGDTRVAVAPRLSLIAPTGSAAQARGFGGAGLQVNLPASVVLNKRFVTHWNAGATVIPSATNGTGDSARALGYNLGQSVIWLAHPRFNVLFETSFVSAQGVTAPGQTQTFRSLLLNPGIRWAHNLKSGMQIVPGVGVPVGVGPSAGEKGLFLYLSFEHPLRAIGGK